MSQGMLPPSQFRGAPKPARQPSPTPTQSPVAPGAGSWQRVAPPPVPAAIPAGAAPVRRTAEVRRARPRTAFFGQSAWGQRIAFVLDTSGSMTGARWQACVRELTAALQALPEDAEIFVALFSDHVAQPPGQAGWMRCRRDVVAGLLQWLAAWVPGGGTVPRPALEAVFALPQRPDAVYFLTDGEFADPTPAQIAALNGAGTLSRLMNAGRRLLGGAPTGGAALHTIALDEAAGAEVLQRMAADSGGSYARVSSAGAPP
jgi:hypothetical protein